MRLQKVRYDLGLNDCNNLLWFEYVHPEFICMAVFRNEVSKEMIKVQSSHKGGDLWKETWRALGALSPQGWPRKGQVRTEPDGGQEAAFSVTELARILILYFWPPELWENKFLLLNPPSLQYLQPGKSQWWKNWPFGEKSL